MTAPTLEAERALFEASGVVGRLYRNNTPGSTEYYEDNYTELAWRVWQEARRTAAPVAEGVALPPKQSIDTVAFRALLSRYNQGEITEAQLIAYIDGRTAEIAAAIHL